MISNDPAALEAACSAVLAEGGISEDLRAWQIRCLILMGAGDADFLDQARRAAHEIPKAELLLLEEADHYAAHMSQDEFLLDAVLRTLQRNR
jgi:pimeloyl-ACP methyl ester carboxylesterase